MRGLPHILIGGGDHARVLAATLRALHIEVTGFTDLRSGDAILASDGVEALGTDDALLHVAPGSVLLVNGIGSVDATPLRRSIFERFQARGFQFATIVHPGARPESDVRLGAGAQLMLGCMLQTGTSIGANTIVNTGAIIDHHCVIGDHCHIAPGAVLSGGVHVGAGTHIGAGATIIQGIQIGDNCVIGAGAVVIRPVLPGTIVVGVPARTISS